LAAIQPLRQRLPILDWHLSAIVPPDSQLQSTQPAELREPQVRQLSEGSSYFQWQASDVLPMLQAPGAPAWYQGNPEVQLSDYSSWAEVASTIHRVWQVPTQCPTTAELAQEFLAESEGEVAEAARRACRYVQDQITTTAPLDLILAPVRHPAQTIELREGDPQAKAVLLASLLRALGAPSAPVAVSLKRARSVASALPTPGLFDHIIIRGRIDDTGFWIDPCANGEAGTIFAAVLPAYCAGLQIGPQTTKLCAIPSPSAKANQLTVTEHFILSADQQATANISTRATGNEANRLRASIAEHGTAQLASDRLSEFARRFPDSTRDGELAIEDKVDENEIALVEKFLIPTLARDQTDCARFSPDEIQRRLPKNLGDSDRSNHPLALPFPCNIRQLTVIDTPWQLDPSESEERLPGSGFSISFKGKREGLRHSLRFAYSTHDDHLAAADFSSAQARLKKLRPHLNYKVSLPPLPAQPANPSAKGSRIVQSEKTVTVQINERKKAPVTGPAIIRPLIGAAVAIALVLIVRATFNGKAAEQSTAIKEKKIAEISSQALAEPAPVAIKELPLDFRDLYEDRPLLKGPDSLGLETLKESKTGDSKTGDSKTGESETVESESEASETVDSESEEPDSVFDAVEFDTGADSEVKASEKKNPTRSDWSIID
ncbi:MAG: transglutaminase-like domain-containing protein, partial [Verrucomicrobiales bacterium]